MAQCKEWRLSGIRVHEIPASQSLLTVFSTPTPDLARVTVNLAVSAAPRNLSGYSRTTSQAAGIDLRIMIRG
jgi:hypothetical protein